jgi:hypothetical protein
VTILPPRRQRLFLDRRGASTLQMLIVLAGIALGGIVAVKALSASATKRTDCAGKQLEAFGTAVPCSNDQGGPGKAAPSPPPPAPKPQPAPEKFDPKKEILSILADILGITDAKKCFTEGDILACVMTFVSFNPFKIVGTTVKILANIPRIKRAIEAFNAARRAERVAEDARRADKAAREAKEAREVAAGGKRCRNGKCEEPKKCFAAGTPVHTENGLVPIEEVQPGDLVLSRDERTGEEAYRPVTRTFVTPEQELLAISLEDASGATETLDVTAPHPFRVEGRGWIPASELEPGDQVAGADGGDLTVAGAEETGRTGTVYNFEVEGFHTYFAGQSAAWVHNDCEEDGPESDNPADEGGDGQPEVTPRPKTLQSGGNTLKKRTADKLNEHFGEDLPAREWGRALEELKREHGLPPNHHAKILENGDYVDDAGNVIDNLGNYV